MPRKGKMSEESCDCEDCCGGHWHSKRAIFLGILILVVGLMMYMGYSWATILIVVGVLVLVKGLLVKYSMM